MSLETDNWPSSKGCCKTCPNAFTDESEIAQSYGCLPDPYDIVKGVERNEIWECHDRKGKACACAVNYAKLIDIEIDLTPNVTFGVGSLNGHEY